MTRRVAHVLGVAVVIAALVASLASLALPSRSEAQQREPVRFGPIPARGDCRFIQGPCTMDAWTGETTVSPKLIKEGETVNVSVAIFAGAISYDLPELGDCSHTSETRDTEVQVDGVWVLQPQEVQTGSSCAWKPGSTFGSWASVAAGITGPCGSQIAVQEGRAEFAACGGATDSDYYGVIGKDEELWGISGRFSAADGRRLGGILVELSGTERQAFVTGSSGDYAFIVPQGSYTVTTEPGFCAAVDGAQGSGCSSSASVSVPDSHSVDFRPEKEGTIKGTVQDAEGKGIPNVTVSAVGKTGKSVATDGKGAYSMTLVTGPYTLSAAGGWRAGVDEAGQPIPVRTEYCVESGADCDRRVRVEVEDEHTVDWHDRGLLGTMAESLVPVETVEPEPSDPGDLDLLFLASILALGGAGVAVGAGAAGGAGGAGGGGGSGPPPKPWADLTDEERERYLSWAVERWKQAHPDWTAEQLVAQIKRLAEKPPGFWDSLIQFGIDSGSAYVNDVTSGEQAEGLLYTFEGMGIGFLEGGKQLKGLASSAWHEMEQLPATLREFPEVFKDDWDSGAMIGRFEGMFEYGGEALDTAAKFYSDPEAAKAAIEKVGKETFDDFMRKAHELDQALMNSDPITIRAKIGEIAGVLEFEALVGALSDKGLGYVAGLRNAGKVDDAVDGLRAAAKDIETPVVPTEILAQREELLQRLAREGRVKITYEEAEALGFSQKELLQRQGTILQTSSGAAEEGAFTVYKISDDAEAAITGKLMREGHPDVYMGKVNEIGDKGFRPGEERFMSPADKEKLAQNPLRPGDTINYEPVKLPDDDLAGLSPEMRQLYNDRMDKARAWDKYVGSENAKEIDLTDPDNLKKYGPLHVLEDTTDPATALKVWKDPSDNRLVIQYQTKDGTWHSPKLQGSDLDTVTHGGGSGLTYEQNQALQYKQAFGQLGEGDTPKWAMSMIEEAPGGGYVLKDPSDTGSLLKAIDQLDKAEKQGVLVQNLDGLFLEKPTYQELEYLKQAARAVPQGAGGWTDEQVQLLQGWGVLP